MLNKCVLTLDKKTLTDGLSLTMAGSLFQEEEEADEDKAHASAVFF